MSGLPASAGDLQAFPCGLLVAGVDGLVRMVNDRLAGLTGHEAQALVGRPLESLFTMAGQAMYQSYLLPMLQLHGRVEEFALALRTADGRQRDVLVYAERCGKGETAAVHYVLVPYEARRAVDDELLRVRRAADQSPGMVFHFVRQADGTGRFLYANDAIRHLYGCTPEAAQADARLVLDRLHPEDRAALASDLPAGGERAGTARQLLLRVLAADGGPPAWHELTACTRRELDGSLHWYGHVADVTRRRALEDEAAQAHAADQVRLAQTEFLGRLSHELRTPLNAILGFSQLLACRDTGRLSHRQREQIALIGQAGTQLLQLVDDVLDITRLQSGCFHVALAPTDARAVLARCLALAAPQAEAAAVALAPVPGSDRPWVLADGRRLEQVLGNLIGNAIKYNHRDGHVSTRLRVDGERLWIAVEDTGCGLSEAQRRQLFQPFNRLGAEASGVPGTGLGLVIARQLIEQMGGSMVVESTPGQGATFSVALPLAWPALDSGLPAPASMVAPRPDGLTAAAEPVALPLLYVEDNPVNALVVEAILAHRPGLQLQVAETGAQALAMARQAKPALLLIDRHLPDTTGNALLGQLRQLPGLAEVPAIMVSAEATEAAWQAALSDGFSDYWTKPLNLPRTLASLDDVLARHAWAAP